MAEDKSAGAGPIVKPVPGAPPPAVLSAINTMLQEWTRVEADRLDWTYQRTEMQNKIDKLEKAVVEHERSKAVLTRQLQALEFGLRQERAKKGVAFASNGGLGATSIHTSDDANGKSGDKLSELARGGNLSKKAGIGFGKQYSTLPANISRHLSSENLPPGRDFLKRYLETSGYLPAAAEKDKSAKPGGAAAAAAAGPTMTNILGRRPSAAAPTKEEEAAAAAAAGRAKAASASAAAAAKTTTTAAAAAGGGASPKPATTAPAVSPLSADKKSPASAAAAAASPAAAGKPADGKSGAPAVVIDEKKGALAAVADLCTKFADQKNATQWKQPLVLKSHMDGVRGLAWHDKEPILLSASEDGTIKFWNLTQPLKDKKKKAPKPAEPLFSYVGHRGMVTSVAVRSGDVKQNSSVAFTGGADGKVIAWKFPSLKHDPYSELGKCSAFKKVAYKHKDAVWSVAVHQTEPLMFAASADGVLTAWKLDADDDTATGGEAPASSMRFSFAHLDATSGDRAIPTCVSTVATDPHKILVTYTNGDLCIVDLSTGKQSAIIKPPEPADMNGVSSGSKHASGGVSSHPSVALALTGHLDQCIRLYDLKSASCAGVLRAHRDAVTSVAIEPLLGIQAATASHDQSIRFWDLGTRKVVQLLEPYQTHPKKFDESIHSVSYHPTLSMVASAGADSVVKVWGM